VTDKVFRERYRVPRSVVDFLEERYKEKLKPETLRNKSLSARQQILIYLHFIGTNSFYHVERDVHGVGTNTVFRVVHKVTEVLYADREAFIHWPANSSSVARKFYEIAGMPSVCGAIDGSHIRVCPPKAVEESYVNRHHYHSLNVLMVCGPDLTVYYSNTRGPGRWHDSRVNYSLGPKCPIHF
jgi:hypothetical protein